MITISGVEVTPENGNVPTAYDIGYALSNITRFGGHTTEPWSVFQHSLACCLYLRELGYGPRLELLALLHDSTEAIISDIPHPWKTEDMRDRETMLLCRILESLEIEQFEPEEYIIIKEIDDVLKDAEGITIGPPDFWVKTGYTAPKAIEAVDSIRKVFRGMNPHKAGLYFEGLVNDYKRRLVSGETGQTTLSELSESQSFNPQI